MDKDHDGKAAAFIDTWYRYVQSEAVCVGLAEGFVWEPLLDQLLLVARMRSREAGALAYMAVSALLLLGPHPLTHGYIDDAIKDPLRLCDPYPSFVASNAPTGPCWYCCSSSP